MYITNEIIGYLHCHANYWKRLALTGKYSNPLSNDFEMKRSMIKENGYKLGYHFVQGHAGRPGQNGPGRVTDGLNPLQLFHFNNAVPFCWTD